MYGLGMVLSKSYLTLLLVRFGTEGLLKAGISSRFHAKHPTKYSACWKSGAKIRKFFGICKFFDAEMEEKWKKARKYEKDPGWDLWKRTKVGCRMICDRMDNVRAGLNPAEWTYKKNARWLTRALNEKDDRNNIPG
jgi:hypothetical protein